MLLEAVGRRALRVVLTLRQLQADARTWIAKQKRPSYLWSHERVREGAAALERLGAEVALSPAEAEFLGPIDPAAMLAELARPETSHRRRALIGERLDTLADPRRGIGADADGTPDIDWCAVSGGEASIEVKRRLLPGSRALRKAVDDFHIARYPVNIAQYRAFLDAGDGWRDPQWWGDDLYRDPEGDSYERGRFGNHPAVYVSWFAAMAFCRWCSRRLGASVRLPGRRFRSLDAGRFDVTGVRCSRKITKGPHSGPSGCEGGGVVLQPSGRLASSTSCCSGLRLDPSAAPLTMAVPASFA
jgi:hypothetical protein